MNKCVICNRTVDTEIAPVLEMGAYGNPKYLCEDCSSDFDILTASPEPEDIDSAAKRMAKKVNENDISEKTFLTVDGILRSASERSSAIRAGEYDFSEDTQNEEGFEEIPEELRETEEDRELDRLDEEYTEKFNKVFDYITFVAAIGIGIFIIWKIVDAFLI